MWDRKESLLSTVLWHPRVVANIKGDLISGVYLYLEVATIQEYNTGVAVLHESECNMAR